MQSKWIYSLFIGLWMTSIQAQNPSPCPRVFSYEPRGTEQDRWYGVLSLQTNEDLTGIWLKVELDRPAELLGNWFGEATSTDNIEYTIKNPKYRLEAGPPVSVRMFVKYNTARTIPSIKSIYMNGKNICVNKSTSSSSTSNGQTLHISEIKPTVTTSRPSNSNNNNHRPSSNTGSNLVSNNNNRPSSSSSSSRPSSSNNNQNNFGNNNNQGSHSNTSPTYEPDNSYSRPSGSNSGSSSGLSLGNNGGGGDDDYFPGDFAQERPSFTGTNTQSSRPNTLTQNSKDVRCGVVSMRPSPLISNGQSTIQGEFPWHAALYHSKDTTSKYICGGSLVSVNHIITAAHCVTVPQTNRVVNQQNILVYLGKYHLDKLDVGVQLRAVSEIYVHPRYNSSFYYNDIAILRLSRSADITSYVRPCCLWEESTNLEDIVNRHGTVVGWGYDQNRRLTNDLMQAKMPIVSTVTCIYSNREFFSQFTSESNFCAGFRNGTSVCNGDSGGGMVLPKSGTSGTNAIWQLRGLVSVSVALQGQGICDPSNYVLFTDVAQHLPWIRQILKD